MTACRTITLLALLLLCPTASAELLLDLVPPSGQLVASEGQTVQFTVTDTTGAPINAVLLNVTDPAGQLLFNNTYTNILGGNTLSGSFPAAVPGTLTLEFIVVQGVSGVTLVVEYVVLEGEPLPDGLLGLSPSTIPPDRTSMVSVTVPEGVDSTGAVFRLSGGASIASVQQLSATVFVLDIATGGPDILRLTLERSGAVLASGVLFAAEQDPFEAIDALAAVASGFQPGDNLLRGLRDNLTAAAEAIRTGQMQDATGALASSVGLLDNLAHQLQQRGLAGGTTGSTISFLREWLIRLPEQKRPFDVRHPQVPGQAPCTVELLLIEHDVAGGGSFQARARQITRAGLSANGRLDETGLRELRAALAGDDVARKAFEKTARSTRFDPGAKNLIVFPGARAVPTAPTNPINNVVLVVFKVTPPGGTVFFRLIDPDEPETSELIDTNGNRGDDNRGFFDSNAGGGFLKVNLASRATLPLERVFLLPGVEFRYGIRPPGRGGFRGLWRPFPSPLLTHFRAFPAGGIAKLPSDPTTGLAAMELALSFAPGDDFRFVADCQKPKIGTGLEQINNSPVITVWRMLHIERDRLESLVEARQRLATGNAADAVRTGGLNQVSTGRAIAMADEFVGRSLTVQTTGGRDRFWLDGRFTSGGRLHHITKFADRGKMQFPRGSLLTGRNDRLEWNSPKRGQTTAGATATFSFGRFWFAGRLSFKRRPDLVLEISSFGTRGASTAAVHFAGFTDNIVNHTILRVEILTNGQWLPIGFGGDPCLSVVRHAAAQGRYIAIPKHTEITTSFEPYEMNHQWVWSPQARFTKNGRYDAYRSTLRAPGKYRIRLSCHDKPVAGPIDVEIRKAPDSLESLLRRINGQFLPGMSLAEDERAMLRQVVAGLPHDDDARPTFEFFRDSYGGRYDRTAREAAWERLRAFPKRFPDFHLRHLMYQTVANLYADPRNPTSREQPMQKHYLDLYNKQWPRYKKPAAEDRR